MTATAETYHRFVLHHRVPEYLQIGWMALPSLEGTGHGIYSAHCVWLCQCRAVEPAVSDTSQLGKSQ
jgi:hypothetical protein